LFAVGEFTGVGGLATDGVARWDGERWQNLGGGFRTDSRSCATTDGTNLFVTSAAPDAHVFEWNHAMWKPHGSTGTDWARGLAVRGGQMLTGGYGIYQITDGGYAELPGSAQMRGASIDAIAFGRDGVVFVGGNFQRRLTMPASQRRTSHFNAPPRGSPESESFSPFHQTSNFAVWNGSTWLDTLGGVGEFPDRVSVIVRQGLYVFVGGVFETAGREPVHSLARWDGKAWHDVGGGVTGDAQYRGGVSAIAFHGNDIYVGGRFSQAGGIRANNVAKWDGQRWSVLGSGVNGRVNALAIVGNRLYVGGEFSTAGTRSSLNFASWRIE